MASAASASVDNSLDRDELAKFEALGRSWWDPKGPMAPLHKLNPVRIAYIRDRVCAQLGRSPRTARPLHGLSVLDVGCGGGLLAEPLARLGAAVTGIDPLPESIATARWHAAETGVELAYEATTLEEVVRDGRRFDLVVASEVIEHVPDPEGFVAVLAEAIRPGGLAILSTVSRTTWSFLTAIVGAEYLLRWLPPGTHDWRRFVRPSELAQYLRAQGLRPVHVAGIAYDGATDSFRLSRDPSVNYLMTAQRPV
ncbi:bifunctional 2-polyprenyl-6-hydroxyphenol methylase/3-demethylubiquinol 3-O-methyltransferase UbiG [Benzoatithermus flavus]|uniref:Ubiquinone biosynthesis O-methyltransferase n=1 Tax=Benzoatithermus flavus TaxID=3108223 RepID=A0ABU8XLD5_9PROT